MMRRLMPKYAMTLQKVKLNFWVSQTVRQFFSEYVDPYNWRCVKTMLNNNTVADSSIDGIGTEQYECLCAG